MFTEKVTFSIPHLKSLLSSDTACVHCKQNYKRSFMLLPMHLKDLKQSVREILASKVTTYDIELGGIIISHKNVKINNAIEMTNESYFKLDYVADIYIFTPEIGSILTGRINKKGRDVLGCLVHSVFNVALPRPRAEMDCEVWIGTKAQLGQTVQFSVVKLDFTGRLPYIRGTLISIESNGGGDDDGGDSGMGYQESIDDDCSIEEVGLKRKHTYFIDNIEQTSPKHKKRKKNKGNMFEDVLSGEETLFVKDSLDNSSINKKKTSPLKSEEEFVTEKTNKSFEKKKTKRSTVSYNDNEVSSHEELQVSKITIEKDEIGSTSMPNYTDDIAVTTTKHKKRKKEHIPGEEANISINDKEYFPIEIKKEFVDEETNDPLGKKKKKRSSINHNDNVLQLREVQVDKGTSESDYLGSTSQSLCNVDAKASVKQKKRKKNKGNMSEEDLSGEFLEDTLSNSSSNKKETILVKIKEELVDEETSLDKKKKKRLSVIYNDNVVPLEQVDLVTTEADNLGSTSVSKYTDNTTVSVKHNKKKKIKGSMSEEESNILINKTEHIPIKIKEEPVDEETSLDKKKKKRLSVTYNDTEVTNEKLQAHKVKIEKDDVGRTSMLLCNDDITESVRHKKRKQDLSSEESNILINKKEHIPIKIKEELVDDETNNPLGKKKKKHPLDNNQHDKVKIEKDDIKNISITLLQEFLKNSSPGDNTVKGKSDKKGKQGNIDSNSIKSVQSKREVKKEESKNIVNVKSKKDIERDLNDISADLLKQAIKKREQIKKP